MNILTLEQVEKLPVFIDGSDGSLWESRNDVMTLLSDPDGAARHFVRLSDLLRAMGITPAEKQGLTPLVSEATLAQ